MLRRVREPLVDGRRNQLVTADDRLIAAIPRQRIEGHMGFEDAIASIAHPIEIQGWKTKRLRTRRCRGKADDELSRAIALTELGAQWTIEMVPPANQHVVARRMVDGTGRHADQVVLPRYSSGHVQDFDNFGGRTGLYAASSDLILMLLWSVGIEFRSKFQSK